MRCTMSPASLFSSTTGAGKLCWFLFVRLCSEYLRVAEYWIMVLLGYHVKLVWYQYVEDKSYHLPLVPGSTSYSETPAAQEVAATW